MKVKVGDKMFDSETDPIMVILSDQDKENIANMLPECTKYCAYPKDIDDVIIEAWMEDV